MKKIERDLLTLSSIFSVLKRQGLDKSDYIKDYDGELVVSWYDKCFMNNPDKMEGLLIQLANKIYKDIQNKK